jgi:hypothetical protein
MSENAIYRFIEKGEPVRTVLQKHVDFVEPVLFHEALMKSAQSGIDWVCGLPCIYFVDENHPASERYDFTVHIDDGRVTQFIDSDEYSGGLTGYGYWLECEERYKMRAHFLSETENA